MADSVTVLMPDGQSSATGIDPSNSGTATQVSARNFMLGAPVYGGGNMAGLFALQIASTDTGMTANTYRHLRDIPYNTSAPTAYSYFGNAFVSLGGL